MDPLFRSSNLHNLLRRPFRIRPSPPRSQQRQSHGRIPHPLWLDREFVVVYEDEYRAVSEQDRYFQKEDFDCPIEQVLSGIRGYVLVPFRFPLVEFVRVFVPV
jgi:hypothetical protein